MREKRVFKRIELEPIHCFTCKKFLSHPRCGHFCNMGCFYESIYRNIEVLTNWLEKGWEKT